MIRKIVMVFILLLLLIPQQMIYANNNNGWTSLDNMADQALILTKQEKYDQAKRIMEQFSDRFLKNYPKEAHITMNDLRVISISNDEAIKALTAVSLEHKERVRKVTQLRLALDALHSEHQPLWMEMEKPVLENFKQMKEAALDEDKEKFKLLFNVFTTNIDTIYPSLVISLDPEAISRLDSHIRFLSDYERVDEKNKENHLTIMEKDMYKLFGKTITDETDPSLIWVMVTTGSIILSVLLYVGLKKFRAEHISTIKYRNR
ncbi:MAG TPA: sporulation protein YpjB [Bacillales bacterium]|nr:sporulation protein YpjB [Bacillales bacterium]